MNVSLIASNLLLMLILLVRMHSKPTLLIVGTNVQQAMDLITVMETNVSSVIQP